MISDSFSRLSQDRARKEIEREFQHEKTPRRNINRRAMKEILSGLLGEGAIGSGVYPHGKSGRLCDRGRIAPQALYGD